MSAAAPIPDTPVVSIAATHFSLLQNVLVPSMFSTASSFDIM